MTESDASDDDRAKKALDKMEQASDHAQRACDLREEARTHVADLVSESLDFDATVTVDQHGTKGFVARAKPEEAYDELTETFADDGLVQMEPLKFIITPSDEEFCGSDSMKDVVQAVEKHHDEDGVPINDVLRYSSVLGLSREDAKDELEKLRRKGEVYEPRQDHLRTK